MNNTEAPKLPSYRWVIVAILSLMTMTSSYVQFQVSAMAMRIIPQLHITQPQFSSLLMAPMLVAVFLSVPAGSLADKFGPKKVVSFGFILSIIGAFGRLFAHSFGTMMLALLMFGCYMSLMNPNTAKILGSWFKQDTNVALGIYFGCGTIGTIMSQFTSSLFKTVNAAYLFSSSLILILAICWLVFVKDAPEGEQISHPQGEKQESAWHYLKVAAKSKRVWILCLCGGLLNAGTMSFSGNLPQVLIRCKGATPAMAGMISGMAPMGALLGSIFGPRIVKHLKYAKPFMIAVLLISACNIYLNTYLPAGGIMICNLIFGSFLGAMCSPILQGIPIQLPEIGPKYAGSAGGISGTVANLMGYFIPVLLSAASAHNFISIIAMQAAIHASVAIFVLILPDANHVK